jgi:hypothetical protein
MSASGNLRGGTFTSPNIGLSVSGANDGVQASATGTSKSGVWAHHDGSNFGYGLFAQSANGPAIGMPSAATAPTERRYR